MLITYADHLNKYQYMVPTFIIKKFITSSFLTRFLVFLNQINYFFHSFLVNSSEESED